VEVAGTRLEYRWHGPPPDHAPTLVFLHEGLGCVSLWRDFPRRLAAAAGCGALVYSRAGYGRSDTVPLPRPLDFMHHEATALGELMGAMRLREVVLVGHSDGASIALIHAGTAPHPGLRSLVLEAPHVFTEPEGLASIARIGETFRVTDLPARLARHHGANTEVAVRGWNDVWLDPGFERWNIEGGLPRITVPALVVQGTNDQYGTWAQIEAIRAGSGGPVEVLPVPGSAHSPHAERPDAVLPEMASFIRRSLREVPLAPEG
jgi:pimeloyl-ACP methyl ester carboxylesterase